jgi:multidrug resistance efflux pump
MNSRKIILSIGLGIAIAAGLGFYWLSGKRTDGLSLHGTVEIQEVRLSSKVGGRIKAVLVREGELVTPGRRLVELEAPELEAQRLQYLARIDQSSSQLDKAIAGNRLEEKKVARAAMDSAEAKWKKLANGYRSEEIEQAQGDLAVAQAEYALTQENLKRAESLLPGGISKAEYDTALSAKDKWAGQVRTAQAKLRLLTKGYRAEEITEAKAEWERARANWELIEAGSRSEDIAEARARVAELKAKLQEVEAQLREAVISAPEQAIVEVLAVRPGDVVSANQPIVRVLRAKDLWVKAFVPEIELGKVHLNQKVEVTCDSYPGKRFQGEVIQIASSSEFTPRNVQSYDERRHQVFAIMVYVAVPQGVF